MNYKASLDCLPTELIYQILNYLDTQTIFLLLYKVCKRLKEIIENYHQCRLDFGLISKSNFSIISRLIHCENIISLTLSDGYKSRGQMQYFFQLFNLNQFTQLRSLNLLQINRHDLNKIFQSKIMFLLHSLKLQFRENYTLQYDESTTLASLIGKKSNLIKLDFNLWFCPMRNIIWPNECILEYLKIHASSIDGYITILRQTPHLRIFILDDLNSLLDKNYRPYRPKVSETFQCVKSLILEKCHRYMDQLEYILSFTPSLIYLKIISDTNLLDGYRWERYIQTNLPFLKKFEFFFTYYSQKDLNNDDIELLIKPYLTSFWFEIKQWFVTCEYIQNLMEIRLYSIPICKTNYTYHFDSNKILSSTSMIMENNSMGRNQVSTMHLNWTKIMENVSENFSNHQLFCKLTDLTLDIEHYWPFDSLQILSKFIDLSYLTDLTLNVTFDKDFIPYAIENITTLLEQTSNVHSLSITYFIIDNNYDTSMEIFCSMIPNHIKYLQIKLLENENQRIIDDMKIILNRLEHLWNITFQFDPFHSIQFDNIIQWLRNSREDFTHIHSRHYLHIWLGKSKDH
jgi:hypothetical protein